MKMGDKNCQRRGYSINGFDLEIDSVNKCRERNCTKAFFFKTQLIAHLKDVHDIDTEVCEMAFDQLEDFKKWLQSYEHNESVQYVTRTRNVNKRKNRETIYLDCNRTGVFKTKVNLPHRQRAPKTQGSSKMNSSCTSHLVVKINTETGIVSVKFWKSHYGHTNELKHLRISRSDRVLIANKLSLGVPPKELLQSIKQPGEKDQKRIDMLSRNDLHNIARSFNLNVNSLSPDFDNEPSIEIIVDDNESENISKCLNKSDDFDQEFNSVPSLEIVVNDDDLSGSTEFKIIQPKLESNIVISEPLVYNDQIFLDEAKTNLINQITESSNNLVCTLPSLNIEQLQHILTQIDNIKSLAVAKLNSSTNDPSANIKLLRLPKRKSTFLNSFNKKQINEAKDFIAVIQQPEIKPDNTWDCFIIQNSEHSYSQYMTN